VSSGEISTAITLVIAGWGAALSTYVALRQRRRESRAIVAKVSPQGTGFGRFRVGNVGQDPTVIVSLKLKFSGRRGSYEQRVRAPEDSYGRWALPHVKALSPRQHHLPLKLDPGEVVEFLCPRSGPPKDPVEIEFQRVALDDPSSSVIAGPKPSYDAAAVTFIDHLDRSATARYPSRVRRLLPVVRYSRRESL
jgi:hypothetical protein